MIHIGPIRGLTVRERSEGSDGLTIEAFQIVYDDAAAAVVLTQVTGLTNRLVALIDDNHPHRSGLFTVRVAVQTETRRLANGNRLIEVGFRLEPQPETVEAAYTLTFDAATSLTPFDQYVSAVHGHYPSSVDSTHVSDSASLGMNVLLNIADPYDAPALLLYGVQETPLTPTPVQVQQGVDPRLYEVGRARIEVAVADSGDWWTLTGDRVPDGHDLRMSNGLVRITVVRDEAYLLFEMWQSSTDQWVQAARFEVAIVSVQPGGFIDRWKVFRNDHAEVVVRCPCIRANRQEMYVDLQLTRGVGMVKAAVSNGFSGGTFTTWIEMQEWDGTNMATETIAATDGIRRTADVGTGNRPYLFGVDSTSTPNATTDRVTYTTEPVARFGLGVKIEGSTYESATSWWRSNVMISDMTVL